MIRVNLGCGGSPTAGWINCDNSLSVLLAKIPGLPSLSRRLGLVDDRQYRYMSLLRHRDVRWADATRKLPLRDGSVDVLYTSHMLEHMTREQSKRFLDEVKRVLRSNGVVRIAVPDIYKIVSRYLEHRDADEFVESTLLVHPAPHSWIGRARFLLVGHRGHKWMYDGPSLQRLLVSEGFRDPTILSAGSTLIPNPGALDLREREAESVYVEAFNK